MARLVLTSEFSRLAGDRTALSIDASDWRGLVSVIERDHPRLAERVAAGVAAAIDGEIVADPLLETLAPDSEVILLQRIEGG